MLFRFLLGYGRWGQETPVRRRARQRLRARLSVEILEDRTLPSTFVVDRLSDTGAGTGLTGDLRYCITQAVDGDTITTGVGVTGTINLTGELPVLIHSISIEGPGPDQLTLRRDTAGNYRIFTVNYYRAVVSISDLTITNGYGIDQGGGIYNAGTLTLNQVAVSGNEVEAGSAYGSGYGGGIYNAGGVLTLNHTTVRDNLAGVSSLIGSGGGIFNENNGTVMLDNSTVSGNGADSGGGISNGGTLTLTNATVSGNLGGGISNGGTLTLTNATVSGNSAYFEGGGVYNIYGAATLSNVTVSGNFGDTGGGGVYNYNGTLTLTDCTVSGNSSERGGGGIYNDSGATLHTRNTIVAGNTASSGPDLVGSLGSLGHNLIGNTQGGSGFDSSDVLNVAPLLGPLQDNGGPTQTMALLAGSPALNAGDPAQLGIADQRSVVRRGGVNIGAYQASASAFVVTVPGTVASGMPFDVTVQTVDVFGQVAFGYRGTVTFRVTDPDPAVMLPADYTFTAGDQGTHTFTGQFTLITPGTWTLTTADLANGLSQDVMLTVNP
jgi:hypothetical protein